MRNTSYKLWSGFRIQKPGCFFYYIVTNDWSGKQNLQINFFFLVSEQCKDRKSLFSDWHMSDNYQAFADGGTFIITSLSAQTPGHIFKVCKD